MKLPASHCPNRENMLREVTLSHVTAKKWIIFSMHSASIVKGYKYRQPHPVASISKLLTFYTAYEIVKEYFVSISTFELLVTLPDNRIGGTRLNLNPQE
jgi:D-alanyl-D-alanine carboxypeptidase